MSDKIKRGSQCPEFKMVVDEAQEKSIKDFLGQNVVLYFYPKDDTSGCTLEAKDFRDNIQEFENLNAVVIGVSKDSLKTHKKFKDKYEIPFLLASDTEGEVCDLFGVWTQKSMYGKKYFGIERSTFLINKEGIISNIWRNVSVPGHVLEVINELKKL